MWLARGGLGESQGACKVLPAGRPPFMSRTSASSIERRRPGAADGVAEVGWFVAGDRRLLAWLGFLLPSRRGRSGGSINFRTSELTG